MHNDVEDIEIVDDESLQAEGYPNIPYMIVPGQHDVNKWVSAAKNIYQIVNQGTSKPQAIAIATKDWNDVESFDFKNWLKYYQEGNHQKYVTAQAYYLNDKLPGYFLPVGHNSIDLKPNDPIKPDPSPGDYIDSLPADDDRNREIVHIRRKLISRLDSMEKLLRSELGQELIGKDFDIIIDSIYGLKKKIQKINKKSSSVITTYVDMIVREGNILNKKGFTKVAEQLYSIADTVPDTDKIQSLTSSMPKEIVPAPVETPSNQLTISTPKVISPNDPKNILNTKDTSSNIAALSSEPALPAATATPPNVNVGNMGTLPSSGPVTDPMPNTSPVSSLAPSTPKVEQSKGMKDFKANLAGTDVQSADYDFDVDSITSDEDFEDEGDDLDKDGDIVVEAQVAPLPPPNPEVPGIKPTEVKPAPVAEKAHNKFDNAIDQALSSLTIDDVIVKLEELSKIFKIREIPRQLSIVDMMLDSLGLASFFPALAEATNKALDSNNYISTRVEDILSQLRGTLKSTKEMNLSEEKPTTSPEAAKIKQRLIEKEKNEDLKKQQKEELEEAPEIDIVDEEPAIPAPEAPPAPLPPVKPEAVKPPPPPPPAIK